MTDFLLDPSLARSAQAPDVIAVTRVSDTARVTAVHSHSRGQLLAALSGLLSVATGDAQWVVPPVHAVWIPPHYPHGLRSHGPFSGWSVYVSEAASVGLPDRPCAVRTSGLLREAVLRAAAWEEGPRDAAQARIADVVLDEIRALPRERLALPMPRDPRLLRIARALADELDGDRRLDDWARWAGITVRTLTRRFLAETGFTFAQWRQKARLMRALEMLAAGTAVTTVALDLGYDNVSAFIAMFRQAFGVTPARFFARGNPLEASD